MSKKLILTVGLPRSGKSTWASGLNYPIVSTDAIRISLHGSLWSSEAEPFVWAIAKVMVRALFTAGHDIVVLDSTAITKKRRDEWRSEHWKRSFKEFNTSKEECIERAKKTNREYLIPVIEKMHSEKESVSYDEVDL